MAWTLRGTRKGILADLEGLVARTIPRDSVIEQSSQRLSFESNCALLDRLAEPLASDPVLGHLVEASVVDPMFYATSHAIPPTPDCLLALIPLLDLNTVQIVRPSVEIKPITPDRHAFGSRTERVQPLFPTPAPNTPKRAKSEFAQPPAPPGLKALSLAERLRWILTPPIQEYLDDPTLALPSLPYPYQQYGIKWLMDRDAGLLADEMGLGKTMQTIVAARLLWRERRLSNILVVCPKTLIPNWLEEIERWWPSAADNTKVIEDRPEFWLRVAMDNITIKVVNYERLARLSEWLQTTPFCHDLIIIDEAQRIKNASTSTARAVKSLKADRRWAITGTPLENHIDDVHSIFGFVQPDLLASREIEDVRSRIKPYMLRRRTEEVALDLPEQDNQDVPLRLTTNQQHAYERAESDGVVALNSQGDTITVQHVFALIQRLIQICNADGQSGESAKRDRLLEDLQEIIDSGRKVLIFSQFVAAPFGLKSLLKELPERCESDMPVTCVPMYGEVSAAQRAVNVQRLRTDPAVNVMLLNYKVGGVGLNLQAANYVYLFDRWWNPAVEDQAVKRAHRIGQQNKVFIRRFFCRDTIEERILVKLAEKRRLFAHVIDDDRPTPEMMGLSEEEVFKLFPGLVVRPPRRAAPSPVRMNLPNVSPDQFEELTARIYEAQGFRVERRGGRGDMGIDLVAERSIEGQPGSLRVAVQCKHYESDVGPAPVRELLGVLLRDQAFHRGDLVTSASFTRAAHFEAVGSRIELIDGSSFRRLAAQHRIAEFDEP